MKILVLDNYDSFTYNLVHMIRSIGNYTRLDVIRNDKIELEEVENYEKILLSPGPGIPDNAGIMKELIHTYGPTKSILGVCLGHQGIAEVYNAKIFNLPQVLHGLPGNILVKDPEEVLFEGLPLNFQAAHYHSWAVNSESINGALKVTAVDESGLVMGISHKDFDVKGLQFHPESVLTKEGMQILKNWLKN